MTQLSVNLNVAALLRNRRDHPWPDVVQLGRIALASGADGLTVHPRPDQRHTRPSDVRDIRELIDREFPGRELNVEGFPDAQFLALAAEVRADQVTLVPDEPDQATSDHGWNFATEQNTLSELVIRIKGAGHRVALFADADRDRIADAAATGTDRVELYTGPFGSAYNDKDKGTQELLRIGKTVERAVELGLEVNAGHDLTVAGTSTLLSNVPSIAEVSIGHALFCDALTHGMAETVRGYARACRLQS